MQADRYKYFRIEARELLDALGQGLLAIEQGDDTAEQLDRMLRAAHTLKGAARVVGLALIAEHTHTLEERLITYRQAGTPSLAVLLTDGLSLLDAIAREVNALSQPARGETAESPAEAPRPAPEESFETVRVELQAMDTLIAGLFEARTRMDGIKRQAGSLQPLRVLARDLVRALDGQPQLGAIAGALHEALARLSTGLESSAEQTDGGLADVQAQVNQMRLLPVSMVFAQLERAARDAAESLGKHVTFTTSGGDTHLDGHVLLKLRDALVHIVRNAIAHGIEPEAERRAAGKPPEGRVRLHVTRDGALVRFFCQDDGRGIVPGHLREAAVTLGILSPEAAAALDDAAALELLFASGFTTERAVNQIAGRGIGLNAVRDTIRSLKGQVGIESEPGRGATITVTVPMSLASLRALLVEAGGVTAALPLDAVVGAFRLSESDIIRSEDRETVLFEGRAIPFMRLARAFGQTGGNFAARGTAVAIRANERMAALGVDRLVGTQEVVVRPLPACVGTLPLVTGASLDAEGTPLPTLDPAGLLVAAGQQIPPAVIPPRRAPILVIDDSLTTRMLEQTILESAGYDVELATSAEEGLEKAHLKPYALFVVDVEMPGMSGFEFVGLTRQDQRLQGIPAILVTSRNAEADRRRGDAVGARAYIVKSEFDQGRFLDIVRTLVG